MLYGITLPSWNGGKPEQRDDDFRNQSGVAVGRFFKDDDIACTKQTSSEHGGAKRGLKACCAPETPFSDCPREEKGAGRGVSDLLLLLLYESMTHCGGGGSRGAREINRWTF